MAETYTQRMRVTFATDDTVKYVGHLDFARAWERAIRRAGLPIAYTQGFNPQARLHFAAALPVGFTGRLELADVFLNEELEPEVFLQRLGAALPPGIRPLEATPVDRKEPSLQAQVQAARYLVEVEVAEPVNEFTERLISFLAQSSALRQRRKGKEQATYDLRPLVLDLAYVAVADEGHIFSVAMRCASGATGRPDELLAELGLERAPRRISRTELLLS